MLAGRPESPVAVPAAVRALAAGRGVEVVWRNELGGLTFAVGERRFVKWAPAGTALGLGAEAVRLADRWADLAVATWSTEWNYGPGSEAPLLDAYGVAADPDRIACYRLLWDLGP